MPDREADTFAGWLKAHRGVQVIARDRAGAYADGANRGAPSALQVADRWHLLRNLTDAVERTLDGRSDLLREAAAAPQPPASVPVAAADVRAAVSTRSEQAKATRRQRRLQRYREVMDLHQRGVPKRTIARQVGLSRQTVMRWIRAGAFPERKPRAPAASQLDPFRPHLERRIREGCRNAAQLYREIRSQGYRGGGTIVRDAVRALIADHPMAPTPRVRRPSVRRTAWLLCLADEDVPSDFRPYIDALTDASSEIRAVRRVACGFAHILRDRDSGAWEGWFQEAAESPLRRFAASLKQDEEAVRAAAELPWSTSPVEGHVNRLKLVKRSMYGRAGFDLLRARVLAAA